MEPDIRQQALVPNDTAQAAFRADFPYEQRPTKQNSRKGIADSPLVSIQKG